MSDYPIKLNSSSAFIQELEGCEYGRYEDACSKRESSDPEDRKEAKEDYGVVVVDFLSRHKTVIEVRNDDEIVELYYALGSGTIGLYRCKAANTIMDMIRDRVRAIDPEVVRVWPFQNGY